MKAKAIITTKWDKKTYRPFTVENVESYFVDTAIDSDSDPFQLVIGDPENALNETLMRDNEVRVQIFGVRYGAKMMFTGLADDVTWNEQGLLTIEGRDLSCIPVDSTIPPQLWKQVKAGIIIPKQARDLGMRGPFHVTTQGTVKKLQFTDGNESYWDFWYRIVRKDQMYIWTGPDGSLWVGNLNYDPPGGPLYYFGNPPKTATTAEANKYMPVETLEFRKSLQGRIAEVWVYGHKGDAGLKPVLAKDVDIQDWIRKPRKLIMDSDSPSSTSAAKAGREEIYESKVGAIEIRITVPDPGYVIQQNNMAHLRVPELGLEGNYFVVGTRIQADSDGFTQEVRLRQKDFALTRRVPADPDPADEPGNAAASALGKALNISKPSWGDYFVAAAKRWHGGWDYALYLATLLAICDQETGFQNERRLGGPGGYRGEWYPPPNDPQSQHGTDPHGNIETLEQWRLKFANEAGDGYVTEDYAVGPMQLLSIGFKHDADDLYMPGHRNEFTGGRWHPQHNIMAAAHALRIKLQAETRDSFRDIDIFLGVAAYGEGPVYAQEVKNKVYNNPGYLQQVKDALKSNDPADTYVNPFQGVSGLNVGRVDMGVDYSGGGHGYIRAIGDARIMGINKNWYKSQPYLYYQLLNGSHAHQYVYVAEGIDILVKPGDQVAAGKVIARFNQDPSNPTIETGWGSSVSGQTLSQQNGSAGSKDQPNGTPEGRSFAKFLKSIGAPAPSV